MDFLSDFVYVNKHSLIKALESLKKNYFILFTGIAYTIINMLAFSVIGVALSGPLSIISGFLLYFIQSAIISNYFYLLFNIINYNRFNFNDFKQGFMYFIWKVYGVLFIIYLGQLLLSALSNILGSNAYIVNIIIQIGVLILFNPLAETIYLKGLSPQDTILYTLDFMKENFVNWLLPNAVLLFVLYLITGQLITNLFNTGIGFNFDFSIIAIARYLLGQLVFSFMMIYRGHLFRLLSTSTMRKRKFMNKF
ncbi:hypothetical protein [Tissierella sp. Yu-01]|uniref:hypothetical protein n=1 Tax=Tissierella sp. Yu-01 TaxID=3035694 RepID=UPI00240E519E|nr:hypothetical protein [Tissierella sp. Yu-01]WFA09871.1 hypothetical protein P3962_04785 [Tissierella sp. Yu-01]